MDHFKLISGLTAGTQTLLLVAPLPLLGEGAEARGQRYEEVQSGGQYKIRRGGKVHAGVKKYIQGSITTS